MAKHSPVNAVAASERRPARRGTVEGGKAQVGLRGAAPASTEKDPLLDELHRLVEAARAGRLAERGRAEQFDGNGRMFVEGVNAILDAVLAPVEDGVRVLNLIRRGDLREKVEIACNGDHDKLKQAINGVHEWLAGVVAFVSKTANGDMTASMAKASDQDQMHEWLALLQNNIHALVADAGMLVKAAVEGKLADACRRHPAPGRLSQDCRGRQPDARCRDRAAERGGGLRGQDQPGRDTAEDHREL